MTICIQLHAHRKAGAHHAFVQGAQVARQAVGQHRHHPIGEIGGIAALARLAVQSRSGAHVMRNIGDGDPDNIPAGVGGICIRLGEDGIVMVARVGRIDGDQRQVAQVFAPLDGRWLCRVSFGDDGIREMVGNAMLVNGDQRHGLGGGRVAQPGDDARLRQAQALWTCLFCFHQLAVAGALGEFAGDAPFLVRALVNGHDAPAFGILAENAQQLQRVRSDLADQPRLILMRLPLYFGQARQNPVALCHRGVGPAGQEQDTRFIFRALPFGRPRELVALPVGRQDRQDADRGQLIGIAVGAAALFQRAVLLQLFQQPLQLNPSGILDAEGLRDIALGRQGRVVGDPLQDLLFGRDLGHGVG